MTDEEIYFTQKLPFEFERTSDGKLVISGWSVHTGKFQNNTIEVPASELSNIAKTLSGKQIRKDHRRDTDSIVGQVLETKVSLDKNIRKKGVKFRGVIRDPILEQKITDGFIDNNSIGFKLYPECSKCGEDFRSCQHRFGEAHVVARDCSCFEQSFVPIGADGDTSIEPGASFSNEEDFTAQFGADKILEEEEEYVATNQSTGNSTTSDTSTYIFDTTSSDTGSVNLPPININVTTAGEKTFSNESIEDGENMEEDFKEELEQVKGELAQVKSERDNLSVQVTQLEADKVDSENKITELEGTINEKTAELQGYKDAEQEAIKLAKETLCNDIIALSIEKGTMKEENKEAKFSELIKLEDSALEQIKGIVEATPDKVVTREEPPVGEFHNTEDGENTMPEETPVETGEFDMEDEKLKDTMHRAMFGVAPKE